MILTPRILNFFAAQFLVCGYAAWRGGAPERLTAAAMAVAGVATAIMPFDPASTYMTVNKGTLLVDIAMFAALVALAVRADRFWPMWVAALQLLAIAVHVVRGLDATMLPTVYNRSIGKIAYPMMLTLAIGTHRHFLRTRRGPEKDWSSQP